MIELTCPCWDSQALSPIDVYVDMEIPFPEGCCGLAGRDGGGGIGAEVLPDGLAGGGGNGGGAGGAMK